jgi:hypothetical protein
MVVMSQELDKPNPLSTQWGEGYSIVDGIG